MHSVYEAFGIPENLSILFVTLALIWVLTGFIPGSDFGVFKVPHFGRQRRLVSNALSVVVFFSFVAFFAPIVPIAEQKKRSIEVVPEFLIVRNVGNSRPDCSINAQVAGDGTYRVKWTVLSSTPVNAYVNDAHVELSGSAQYQFDLSYDKDRFTLSAENAYGDCSDEVIIPKTLNP